MTFPQIIGLAIAALIGALVTSLLMRRSAGAGAPAAATPSRREELFRVAFDRAPVGIALVGLDGLWLQVNPRLALALGTTREELLRTTLKDIIHPDDRPFEESLRKRVMAGEQPVGAMDVRLAARGGPVGFRMSFSLCKRGVGEPGYLQYIFDTLPDKGATRSSLSLESVFDQLDDVGLVRFSANGKIVAWNRGAETILGYRADDVKGKGRSLLYPDAEVAEGTPEADAKGAMVRGRHERDASLIRSDGLVITVRTTFLRTPDGGIATVLRTGSARGRGGEGALIEERAALAALTAQEESTRARAEALQRDVAELRSENARLAGAQAVADQAAAESKALIARLREEGERKISELLRRIDVLKNEVRRREGIEKSLRSGFEELQSGGEQTVDELRRVTLALRDEISRRKEVEAELDGLRSAPERNEARSSGAQEAISDDVDREWSVFDTDELRRALEDVELRRGSGTVILRHDDESARIFYDEGAIVGCLTSLKRIPIGEQLVSAGHLTAAQRDRALEMQEQTGIAFGRILLIMNAVDYDVLFGIMRDRATVELGTILTWSPVAYTFAGDLAAPSKLVPLRLPLADLIAPAEAEVRLFDEIMSEIEEEVAAERASSTDVEVAAPAVAEPAQSAEAQESPVSEDTVVITPPPPSADMQEPSEETQSPAVAEANVEQASEPAEPEFVGGSSKKARKYHRRDCRSAERIPDASRVYFATRDEAEAQGYEPCGQCVAKAKKASPRRKKAS